MEKEKKECDFCSGRFRIENITIENLDWFDNVNNAKFCNRHAMEVHSKIAKGLL